jgi:hypothetical protein
MHQAVFKFISMVSQAPVGPFLYLLALGKQVPSSGLKKVLGKGLVFSSLDFSPRQMAS